MSNFKFNTLYILESLNGDDSKTGKELYDELSNWINLVHKDLRLDYKSLEGRQDFLYFFDFLYNDVSENGCVPLLHFEIHGDSEYRGLTLSNGELVSFPEFGECLQKINMATGCNLFISLAVCYGLRTMFEIHTSMVMPFCGVLGSFYKLYEEDLRIRFYVFYEEFFNSLDLVSAYRALLNANGGLDANYCCYMADKLFIKSYKGYLEKECSPERIDERAQESYDSNLPYDLETFKKLFKEEELKRRDTDYKAIRDRFFMINEFPENKSRFSLPETTEQLLRMCKELGW